MDEVISDAHTTLYHGDCEDVMRQLPDSFVDLVLTDPPYTKDTFYPAYKKLAAESPRLMKQGASLVTLAGQYLIEDIVLIFRNKLKYNWIVWMNQPQRHVRMALGIEVTGMPNLWYVKSSKYATVQIPDGFSVEGTDGMLKPLHPWQKDLSWADFFIKHLTRPGDVVLDPFVGSGTVLASAKKLGRIGIGIEIDKGCCEIAAKRLREQNG